MSRRRLVYTVEDLDTLAVGAVVRAHRRLAGRVAGQGTADSPYTDGRRLQTILVRQPTGWFGAWDNDLPVPPAKVVPCTVLVRERAR